MQHTVAFSLVALNFLCFGLAAVLKFRNEHATNDYKLFTVVWWASCLVILLRIWSDSATTGVPYTVAVVLNISSILVFLSALRAMWEAPLTLIYSKDVPEELQMSGIYKLVRHPFYTSYILTYLASFFFTLDFLILGVGFAMGWLYLKAAKAEELKFSQSSLAEAYKRYKINAGGFFPRVWR